jgi:hypothetical protein
MNDIFDNLVKSILENNTTASVLGTPVEMIYDPNKINNTDSFQRNDMRKPFLLGKKTIKRNTPENIILNSKNKKKKRKK